MKLSLLRNKMNLVNLKARKEIARSKIIPSLTYGAPLFASETSDLIHIFHTAMMSIYRAIKNRFVYRESCRQICLAIEEPLPKQLLKRYLFSFAHKVIHQKRPRTIYNTLKFPTFPRKCKDIFSSLQARTDRRKRTLTLRVPKIFNSIPQELKYVNPQVFKTRIKKYDIADIPID